MTHDWVIDVKHLKKTFGTHEAVKDLSLQVKKGDIFGFLGPNGSGKTTTIRMLCGLLTPDAGEGTCLGYDIRTEAHKIKRHIGYMTQKFSFYTDLTIRENLEFIAGVYDLDDRRNCIEQIMDEMQLRQRQHQLAGTLSGGWKQRMALAACLLHRPSLLLLDEPTAGIDPIARRDFWDKIHALSEKGVTTLMSTHYMDEAERSTRLAYLAYGELIVSGNLQDVINKTQLKTWEITGTEVSTRLLAQVKKIKGVTQAALFGRKIHLCGLNVIEIEKGLAQLSQKFCFDWQEIEPTLEDAFINLVMQTKGEFA